MPFFITNISNKHPNLGPETIDSSLAHFSVVKYIFLRKAAQGTRVSPNIIPF